MADDLERLQRYLQWRDRTNEAARRSVRRRRLRGLVVAAAVALVGVATLSWLSFGMRAARPVTRKDAPAGNTVRATDVADASADSASDAPPAPPTTPPASTEPLASTASPTSSASPVPTPSPVATAPQVIGRAPVAPKPSPNASRRTARAMAHQAPSAPSPDRIRAEPVDESTSPSAAPSDRAATSSTVATTNVHPQSTPTELVEPAPNERRESVTPVETATPSTVTSPTVAEAPPAHDVPAHNAPVVVTAPASPSVVENPPVAQTPLVAQPPVTVTVAPGTVTSIESKPPCDDVTAAESADDRSRRQRVSDCVGGWLKGQSREFRDGVKREFDDVRAGLDQVGRGLQWLGSKLRRPGE